MSTATGSVSTIAVVVSNRLKAPTRSAPASLNTARRRLPQRARRPFQSTPQCVFRTWSVSLHDVLLSSTIKQSCGADDSLSPPGRRCVFPATASNLARFARLESPPWDVHRANNPQRGVAHNGATSQPGRSSRTRAAGRVASRARHSGTFAPTLSPNCALHTARAVGG